MESLLNSNRSQLQEILSDAQMSLSWNQLNSRLTLAQRSLAQLLMGTSATQWPSLRPLVYTSFDGDHMHWMHWMCFVAQSLGYTPINPEAALGSFLLNTTHAGSKIEIMRDCISLELCCDEFWHFDAADNPLTEHLAEGVVAELLMWQEHKHAAPVRLFPWIESRATYKYIPKLMPNQRAETLVDTHLSPATVTGFLDHIDSRVRQDIDQRLLQTLRTDGVRPLVFLSQGFADFKHTDWARWLAYRTGYVPLCPDTLLDHFVLDLAHGAQAEMGYWLDRLSVLNAAQELWVFAKPGRDLFAGEQVLSAEVAVDLYFWLLHKPAKPVRVVSWREAEVPKYQTARWAITTREHAENLQL